MMRRPGAGLVVVLALGAALAGPVGAASVSDDQVREVALQLRCVVCQSLSVADSPSETARQMREIIRTRLADGETPAQVIAYFVGKYGDWILLAPPARGFSLLVWVVPYVALVGGLVLVGLLVWRWNRRSREAVAETRSGVDEATRQRIRRELAEMDRE